MFDLQLTQQIGELILGGIGRGGPGHAVHRLDAHELHRSPHLVTTDHHALLQEFIREATRASTTVFHVQFIHEAHDPQVFLAQRLGCVVEAAALDVQHLALLYDAELLLSRIYQRSALLLVHHSSFF